MKKLVTQAEFARLAGVNRSTVTRWIQNGRIEADPTGLIDQEAASRMREATESPMPHHQARKAQFDAEKKTRVNGAPEGLEFASSGGGEYQDKENGVNIEGNAQRGQQHSTAGAQQNDMPAIEKIGAALKLETYKLQKAKAETANMELDKLAGALVERAEVDLVLADFGATLRGLMENLPMRLHAVHQGDHQKIAEIEGVATDLLTEMSEHMKRKMENA